MNDGPRGLWVLLLLLVVASFAVRAAAWAYWQTGSIESEGAEYARLAENLRNGVGYIGLVSPGTQLNFNPLFPLLIAGASFLTYDYELAGRLVALITGALLPLPVFGIASRLFSRRVGLIAASLSLLHPLLLHLSFSVFSEGPYTTLFLSSVYVVVRALEHYSVKLWFLVGAAFGLTWLVRTEAALGFAVAVLFALMVAEGDRAARWKQASAAVAAFLLLAMPQVIFIYKWTGQIRMEVKSTIFFYTGKRMLAAEKRAGVDYESPGGHHEVPSPAPNNPESSVGWEEKWAFYGIDSNLNGMGFPARPHADIVRETHIGLGDLAHLVGRGVLQNAEVLPYRLSSDWFGAPLLPALALFGAFRRPWRGSRASTRWFVLLVSGAPGLATFFALWSDARYYFVLIPLMSIWAANGLYGIGSWLQVSTNAAGWRVPALPVVCHCVVPGLIGLAMLVGAVDGVGKLYLFKDSALPTRVDKEVGLWIRSQQSHSVRIMDLSIPLTFHAGAQFSYFPYCTGEMALRYLDAAGIDYVVLRRGRKFTKYYAEWLTHGIPDQRAELLKLPSMAGADAIEVFRWHRRDVAEPSNRAPERTRDETGRGRSG